MARAGLKSQVIKTCGLQVSHVVASVWCKIRAVGLCIAGGKSTNISGARAVLAKTSSRVGVINRLLFMSSG